LGRQIIQALGRGERESAVAVAMIVNRKTVRLWRERFQEEGLQALWEIAPGRGRKPIYGADRIKALIDATLQSKPKGSTHWSCRLMATNQGLGKSTVSQLWRSHNIKPHRTKKFKLSRDPKFLEKLTDVVGLYLNPPDKAIVLCVDEKNQIQALDRTQPGLPLKKGRCGTMTHDYKRNGTTTLFAALDLVQGKVIGDFRKRHRHQEYLKFLRRIDKECSPQRRRSSSRNRRIPGRLERQPEAICLDCDGGIDHCQTHPLSSNPRTDSTRLHAPKVPQT
jgi:transposase